MKNILLVMATIVLLYALTPQSVAQVQTPLREKIDSSPRLLPLSPTGTPVPRVTAFPINNGAPNTKSRTVSLNKLHYTYGGASHYGASERGDFPNTYWRSYANAPEYAKGEGYTFTAIADDPNSECRMIVLSGC